MKFSRKKTSSDIYFRRYFLYVERVSWSERILLSVSDKEGRINPGVGVINTHILFMFLNWWDLKFLLSQCQSPFGRGITRTRAIPEMVPVGFPFICDRCVLGAINGTLSLNACRQMMFSPTHAILLGSSWYLLSICSQHVLQCLYPRSYSMRFFPYILGKRRFSSLQDQFLTMELFMCPAGNLSISLFKCGSESSHECLHFVPLHDSVSGTHCTS